MVDAPPPSGARLMGSVCLVILLSPGDALSQLQGDIRGKKTLAAARSPALYSAPPFTTAALPLCTGLDASWSQGHHLISLGVPGDRSVLAVLCPSHLRLSQEYFGILGCVIQCPENWGLCCWNHPPVALAPKGIRGHTLPSCAPA